MTRDRLALIKVYCLPLRTWARNWKGEHEAHVAELTRYYLGEHPGHDFTIGTTAQRAPVH